MCLGIFGTTAKVDRVVPNKIFECLAMGRPAITADATAARSALHGEIALVPAGDPEALASVRELLRDDGLLTQLAAAGHAGFKRDYSGAALAHPHTSQLGKLVGPRGE